MALVTPGQLKANYDVIVVGSGAGGGQAAYTLTLEGIKVLLLEAGRNYVPETETPMFETPDQAPLRAAGTPDKPFGFHDSTIDGGWTVPGEPYTSASSDRGRKFEWWRARMLGGRTNHWGRYSFRNGQYDFKPRSRDGLGFDWPMDYADLAPYYDKVEMLIGVYGENDGLENTPDSPPGVLLPAPKPRVSDLLVKKHAPKLGIPMVAAHRAVLTKRLDAERLSARSSIPAMPGAKTGARGHGRPGRLFLGDRLRPRLLHPRQLPVDHRPPAARHGQRASRPRHQRDGARGHDQRRWPGQWRDLHRQDDRPRAPRHRPAWSCSPPAPAKPCACC
jgi:choline dehydrogenase-like flavoprotein